jgi:hypothetical protein
MAASKAYPCPPGHDGCCGHWTLDISDVVLEGTIDLWIAELRLTGQGTVAGGVQHEQPRRKGTRRC